MAIVAYLGPENTNTHSAAQAKFGTQSKYVHAPTVEEVFHLVERRRARYGVVPIENSLEGAVAHTLDRFIDFPDSPARIHGEIELPIVHYLIFRPTVTISHIRVVYSHPQALAQCRGWLEKKLPKVHLSETNSTAEAVNQLISSEPAPFWDLNVRAAIGRKELAQEFKLKSLQIPEERENRTRFLVIGLGHPPRGRRNKTSILFALKDRPGALHDALVPFKRNGINLTKIESRPSKRKAWEYLFFIDVEGSEAEAGVKRALQALESHTALFRVLGSYPVTKR